MISTLPSRKEEKAQVCIVGSGAAGGVLAYELAAAGLDVIVLEEGGEFSKSDFTQREDLIPRIYADAGARATHDAAIPILQGKCPVVRYEMNHDDRERVRKALKLLAGICLEGGAARVATTHVKPVEMAHKSEVSKIDQATFRPNDLTVFSAHPQGGCPMGENRTRSVVNSRCAVHGIEGLYVCDASVFPSPVGVNPMISIMALASLTAERIVHR